MTNRHTTTTPGGEATENQPDTTAQENSPDTASQVVYAYNDPATLAKAGRIIRAAMARQRARQNIPAPRNGD
jgi:hypothetical protein